MKGFAAPGRPEQHELSGFATRDPATLRTASERVNRDRGRVVAIALVTERIRNLEGVAMAMLELDPALRGGLGHARALLADDPVCGLEQLGRRQGRLPAHLEAIHAHASANVHAAIERDRP